MENKIAIVLFSGGLDSTTCLYYAKDKGYDVITLSFMYEQRHKIELEYAQKLIEEVGVKESVVLSLDMSLIGGSALTSSMQVPKGGDDLEKEEFIPTTYVPARNLVFLSLASALAESRNAKDIFIGVNALDYSGYPDCREEFIHSFEKTVNLGTKKGVSGEVIQIHTPLINMTKKEIIELGNSLKVPYEKTWSCYDPQLKNGKYIPCGECDSCLLRQRAFREVNN